MVAICQRPTSERQLCLYGLDVNYLVAGKNETSEVVVGSAFVVGMDEYSRQLSLRVFAFGAGRNVDDYSH